MKSAMLVVLLTATVGVGGCWCCPAARSPVAVSELRIRSDDYALPMQTGDQASLIKFLAQGGDRDLEGDLVNPNAGQVYGPLLKLLESPANLDREDLSNGTFKRWFADPPTQQVIDAREKELPAPGSVYAVSDGRFWWVFRIPCGEKLARLVVFKAGPASR